MSKLTCFIVLNFMLCTCCLAQNAESRGHIRDSSGNPISNVSVIEAKTKNGTITDKNGFFKLLVKNGAVLLLSRVGYTSQQVAANGNLELVLQTSQTALTEVVITALGIRREKKALGYAVSTVNGRELELRPEGDLGRLLSGKAPGVNVLATSGLSGSGTNIVIRAVNSLSGSVVPLFVVDGVPFDGNTNAQADFRYGNQTSSRFLDLDANNVESVDILKGLSATTLYGEAGRNGVIVVTTKNGALNKTLKNKAEITVNQSLFINQVSNLPKYQDSYGAGFQQLLSFAFSNWGPKFTNPPAIVGHPYDRPALSGAFPQFKGASYEYKPYNSVAKFFRSGLIKNTSVNVAGGGNNTNFNANFSYLDDEGFVPGNRVYRTTVGLGGATRLTNHFSASGTFNYVNNDVKSPPTGYSSGSGAVNGTSVFGDLIYTPRSIDLNGLPYENPVNHSSMYYRGGNDIQNPIWTIHNAYTQDRVSRTYGNVQLKYDIRKNLDIIYRLGYDKYNENNVNAQNKGGIDGWPTGIFRTTNGENTIWYHTLFADYKTTFGSKWNLTVNAGVDSRENNYQQSGLNSTQQLVYGLFDHSNFISHGITNEADVDLDFQQRDLTLGAFVQGLLGYKEYVYLNLGGRKSWVSTLEKGNNSLFYPSVSLSFIPTSAFAVLKTSQVLNYLKLRAGYSTSARFPETPYTTRPVLNITTNLFVDRSGNIVNSNAISDRLANTGLKPELQQEAELGLEAKLFDNRLSFDFTVYRRISKDQILDRELDNSTGFTLQQINAGNLRNKGIELAAGYTVIRRKNLSWQLDGNFTLNRSLVYDMPQDIEQIILAGFSTRGNIAKNGLPLGVIYGTYVQRDAKSGALVVDANGDYLTSADQRVIGNPTPDYKLTGISTLNYKGFSFRMQWDFTKGGDIYTKTVATLLARGLTKDTDFDRDLPLVLPGVKQDGTTNDIQTTASDAYFNTYLNTDEKDIFDATLIRLRELSLSYILPTSVLKKTPFGGISFTLSGQNLWYNAPNMPKYTRFDPETTSLGVGNSTSGFEYLTGPSSRRIGASLRITF
ncbi:MAG: SusC/RagA family TonB-linked outer membrane protein [Chitinophagaceae bacterium]